MLLSPPPTPPPAIVWRLDAPDPRPDPADYLWRFPDRSATDAVIGFLARRSAWLDAQGQLHGDDPYWQKQFAPAVEDNERRRAAWCALWLAQEFMTKERRESRGWLMELRREIGVEDFERGVMPQPLGAKYIRRAP